MWSLKGKQQEVKDYYQATAGNNMVMVWLLSAITFVATILVVLGLFWAGRWIYQKVTAPDKNQPAVTENQPSEQPPQDEQPSTNPGADSGANPSPSTPTPSPTPAPTQPTPPTTTPQTGPTELVQTGPSSDE